MTTPHKATPEQWRWVSEDACLIELRDRLAAAEQRISELEQRPIPGSVELATDAELIKAWDVRNGDHLARIRFIYNLGRQHGAAQATCPHIPASGLVERVARAIPNLYQREACAAIFAVAEWFDGIGYGATASILRQEVKRD